MKTDVLPNVFVWTKIGDDSGQGIQAILNRKELERQAANKFWWGVGRPIGPQIKHLLTSYEHREVIFSEMPSKAHDRDSNPDGVLLWEKYVTPTRVDICWGTDGDTLTMSWAERGGPPVSPPEQRGFGSTVIVSMVKTAVAEGRRASQRFFLELA